MDINGTTNQSVNLTAGVYTLSSLIVELTSKLDDASVGLGDGGANIKWTIAEDAITKLLTFTSTHSTTAHKFKFSSSLWTLPREMLGYSSTQITDVSSSSSGSFTSLIPPDVLWTKFLFIKFTNISQPVESTNTNLNSNFVVPNNGSAKMTNIISFNNYQMINRISPTDIHFLDVELRDDNNDLINVRGSWQMVIEVG
jgi:hypothetical protein